MKKLLVVAFALACSLTLARTAKAAGTEFGVDDDLTVLGTDGGWATPDVGIKGFSIFGASTAAHVDRIVEAKAGSVAIGGALQVDGAVYASSMTLTGEVRVLDVPRVSSVDQYTRILVQNSTTGLFEFQILRYVINPP